MSFVRGVPIQSGSIVENLRASRCSIILELHHFQLWCTAIVATAIVATVVILLSVPNPGSFVQSFEDIHWVGDPPDFANCVILGSGVRTEGPIDNGTRDSIRIHVNNTYEPVLVGDVLFTTFCAVVSDNTIRFNHHTCRVEECGFRAIIFRTDAYDSFCASQREVIFSRAHNVSLGISSPKSSQFVHRLCGRNKPTTGFHAIAAMVSVCSSIRLVGFQGSGTIDDHEITVEHDIDAEHKVLYDLMRWGRITIE